MDRSVLLLLVIVSILVSGCMQSEIEDELSRARKAFINKEYTEAERFYQRYLRDNDSGIERWNVWNRLVEVAGTVRGNKNRAIELLDAMLLEYSGEPDRYRQVLVKKGNMLIEGGLWSEAITVWSQLLSAPAVKIEEEATAYANLGKAYLMRGEYGLAVDAFKDCRELEYNNSGHKQLCIYELAQAYAFLGNHVEAEKNLNNLLQYEAVEVTLMARAKLLLADIYEQQEQPQKAIALLQDIRETYPNPRVVEFRLKSLQK
ncbi:tetratricopeptide repeat protein [Halodesulfovibrio marinisediminis]|uniref:Putative negative regulator of RcsB-dependent stress response n=1 Tax=Halodesulfovibrio marinisediminis DSM 17456 TaxID=1121457 RepID=A0A1N6EVJ0_9BACT|nr:tetratricopeptide repeat protein [Halodesulfovibrio marinisediminis]SIN87089.1 Putative negative regulator of RcsB-dependent stress response [Halodesulfovibrio marinisediminis DSM 17456]